MRTTKLGWTIIDDEAGVLSYSYSFRGEGQANCFTARLPSGGLMVISPPSKISDEVFTELETFGEVEAIVANNGFHYFGIRSWRDRYPKAGCFAAPGAIARINKKAREPVELRPLAELAPRLGDDVAVIEAPTSRCGETWAWAKIDGGYAWYASDILANMELPSNFLVRALFKLSDSAPGYRVFGLAVRLILKDKRAALGSMLADVREHPPTVMVPAHGAILQGDALLADTQRLLADAVA
jgi:hypothetical protein